MSAPTKALLSGRVTGLTPRQPLSICSTFSPAGKRRAGRAREVCSVTRAQKRRNTWPQSILTRLREEKRRIERGKVRGEEMKVEKTKDEREEIEETSRMEESEGEYKQRKRKRERSPREMSSLHLSAFHQMKPAHSPQINLGLRD